MAAGLHGFQARRQNDPCQSAIIRGQLLWLHYPNDIASRRDAKVHSSSTNSSPPSRVVSQRYMRTRVVPAHSSRRSIKS